MQASPQTLHYASVLPLLQLSTTSRVRLDTSDSLTTWGTLLSSNTSSTAGSLGTQVFLNNRFCSSTWCNQAQSSAKWTQNHTAVASTLPTLPIP